MNLYSEEPDLGPWQSVPLADFAAEIPRSGERTVIAVDGRGGAGKSTLADALAAQLPAAEVIHTDDLAWHEPLFGWDHLLRDLFSRIRAGGEVSFTPPAWVARGRQGALTVAAETRTVILEGTRSSSTGCQDLMIWVQSDRDEARRRGLERDAQEGVNGDAAESAAFWDTWEESEREHLRSHRPWDSADIVVLGTSGLSTPSGHVSVASAERAP